MIVKVWSITSAGPVRDIERPSWASMGWSYADADQSEVPACVAWPSSVEDQTLAGGPRKNQYLYVRA
jgi:hypothetical protein